MLSFADVMVRVADLGAAERSMVGLLGFLVADRQPQWVTLRHPATQARITITEEDFGEEWALACHADELPPPTAFEEAGFAAPDEKALEAGGFAVLRAESGLILLLYR